MRRLVRVIRHGTTRNIEYSLGSLEVRISRKRDEGGT